MGAPVPIKKIGYDRPIQPLIDQLIEPTKHVDANPDPVIEQKVDPEIDQDFNSIQSTLKKIMEDSRYGPLKEDLASIDTGLTALRKVLANYRKR